MRKLIAAASLALTTFSVAFAAQQDGSAEGRAYLGFSFGGQKASPRDFHYGLRFDYDTRAEFRPAAPVMQFDFTHAGLSSANVNGLNILKKSYTLKQNDSQAPEEVTGEEAPAEAPAEGDAAPADEAAADATADGAEAAEAAPAEQPGFFARSWHGIKSLFGGGDDEPAEAQTAAADQAPAKAEPAENPADVAEGTFMGYNAIDWATLAVGAVGLGFIVAEVANGEESSQQSSGSSSTTTTGSSLPIGLGVSVLPTGVTGVVSTGFLGAQGGELSKEMQERVEWLDGGTGHMGDLAPAKN